MLANIAAWLATLERQVQAAVVSGLIALAAAIGRALIVMYQL
jgi:hypothetical protein